MTLLLNFITVLACMWSLLMAVVWADYVFGGDTERGDAAIALLAALPALAWIIARFLP